MQTVLIELICSSFLLIILLLYLLKKDILLFSKDALTQPSKQMLWKILIYSENWYIHFARMHGEFKIQH